MKILRDFEKEEIRHPSRREHASFLGEFYFIERV
jgi:hypothetical protein